MFGATLPALAPALVAISLAMPAAGAEISRAAVTAASPDSMTATVRDVHTERRGMDVIYGYHLALKVTYVRLAQTAVIEMQGQTVRLQDLRPGAVVTIHYRETADGKVADSVKVHAARTQGGER